jgi:hypothetical protein
VLNVHKFLAKNKNELYFAIKNKTARLPGNVVEFKHEKRVALKNSRNRHI